jgi:hypothetical protein
VIRPHQSFYGAFGLERYYKMRFSIPDHVFLCKKKKHKKAKEKVKKDD